MSDGRTVRGEPDTTIVPTSLCPHCGLPLDAATNLFDAAKPKPGDVTVCLGCAGLSMFDENLQLRTPTESELAMIESKPDVRRAVAAIRYAHRKLGPTPFKPRKEH